MFVVEDGLMALQRIGDALHRFGLTAGVIAVSVARMGDGVSTGVLLVILPLYIADTRVAWLTIAEPIRVGIALSLFGIASAVAQPFLGALVDRTGRHRLLMLGGLGLLAVSTAAFAWAQTYEWLLLLRVVQGIALAATIPSSVALLTISSEKQQRGRAMGFYTTLRVVGLSLGPLIGGATADYFGFAAGFYVATAFVISGMAMVWAWVHDEKDPPEGDPRPFRIVDRELLTPGILALGLATFVMAGAFSMIIPLEKQYAARLHQGAFSFGFAISALMFSRIACQVPLGWVSDRIGRRVVIIAGLVLMAPAALALGLVTTTLQLALARVFLGIGSAGVAASAFAAAGDLSHSGGRGRQLSVLTIGFGLGIAFGPLIAGSLVVVFFLLPFILFAALLLVGAFVVYRYVPETTGKNAKERPE